MARAAKRCEIAFESAHFRAVDELAVRQNTRHGVVDCVAETAALRSDINERNRPFFKASMLIHNGTYCL
jgi:hypothetical protein